VIYALLTPKTRWMGKQMWYTYNRILFSLKKGWNSDAFYNMDEPWKYYAKQERHKRTNIVWLHLCKSPEIIHEIIETENIIDVSKS
jgi:hypothetical protein